MERYLIDTNVVSDYFSASLPAGGLQFMDSVIDAVTIPVIALGKTGIAF
jgi:predicted nucleic acid-binding protein